MREVAKRVFTGERTEFPFLHQLVQARAFLKDKRNVCVELILPIRHSSRRVSSVLQPPCHADAGERVQHRADGGGAFAFEGSGDVLRGEGRGGGCEDGLYGADLFGERAGPGDDVVGEGGSGFAEVERLGDRGLVVGGLIFGAQPADQAAGFLGGCKNMTTGQKRALTGAALGTGIGKVAGGSFGEVVGAGLIGGAAGYITGSAIGNK